jgi:hypothetical protein
MIKRSLINITDVDSYCSFFLRQFIADIHISFAVAGIICAYNERKWLGSFFEIPSLLSAVDGISNDEVVVVF